GAFERAQLGRDGGGNHVEVAHPAERRPEPAELVPQPIDRAPSEQWTAGPQCGPQTADRDAHSPQVLRIAARPELGLAGAWRASTSTWSAVRRGSMPGLLGG